MGHLHILSQSELSSFYESRENELKWGDVIHTIQNPLDWEKEIQNTSCEYIVIGINEDIGIRANSGRAGAAENFHALLPQLLSLQHNRYNNASMVMLLGYFEFEDEMREAATASATELRNLCVKVDELVAKQIEKIASSGKKIIAIGGGHNNAYPIIKGISRAKEQAISCLNFDAHSDYRLAEGRHSGNGFRYAMQEGYLDKYRIMGLHENYTPEYIIEELEANPKIAFNWFEEIKIRKRQNPELALNALINALVNDTVGIEIDLDSIAHASSSAQSPSGWELDEMRGFLHQASSLLNCTYLHLCEGRMVPGDIEGNRNTAKLLAYLLSDFCRSA